MNLFFIICILFLAKVYGKTTSCVGYVKSNIPVDLSKVQIKLFTDRGNLKFETECNPSDGFFTIPVYNPGKYQIKIITPNGWIFEKNFRNIEIGDGTTENGCEEDINFMLYGFTISGTVRSGSVAGPSGFPLALYNSKTGVLISSVITTDGGEYEFVVNPGDYVISTEDRSSQCIDRGKVDVKVENEPVRVNPDIQISGYNLKVSVRGENGAPLPDAVVTLNSKTKLQFENIPVNAQKPKSMQEDAKWLYKLKCDVNGVVHFYCLPPDNYLLGAYWKAGNIQLNFGAERDVNIDFSAAELVLKAISFDVVGEVANMPISDAEIFLNGKKKAVSDESGKYTLKNLKSDTYKLTAAKEYYKFSEATIKLSATSDISLPAFEIEKIAVCGSVDFDSGRNKPKEKIAVSTVQLVVRFAEDKRQVDVIDVDQNNNKFCKYLPPGVYLLEPSNSLRYSFSPASMLLEVLSKPIMDLHFTQFKAVIAGEVKCFESCKNVIIQLLHGDELVNEQSSTGTFKFIDVAPASYIVKIRDDYNFWWQKSKHFVEVTDKDVKGLLFQQSGYKAVIQASHSCTLKYAPVSAKNLELKVDLIEGINVVFFPQSGKYSFTVDSCRKFLLLLEHSNAAPLDHLMVPSSERWVLIAKKARISVSIVVLKPAKDADFHLNIKNSKNEQLTAERMSVSEAGKNHTFVFYVEQDAVNERFLITPRSDKYIFRPASASFLFDGECQWNVAVFYSEIGKMISGTIFPAVDKVYVTLTHKTDSANILTTITDLSGKYSIGGIWNVDEWLVSLKKEGYEFKPVEGRSFDFRSVKLSYLRIDFIDVETSHSLADVLVSISGPNNYRSSNLVDASGSLTVIGLAAGEYFLRPILQEYKFKATSTTFQINEGETQKLVLSAKKFAYSAFGKITTITKQPIKDVVHVEAVSEQCSNHQEEYTTSLESSDFRIRGLRPDCTYRLTLKNEDGQRLNSYPPFVDILTGTSDKHDISFIVTPSENQMTLFGKIDFPLEQHQQQQKQRNNNQQQQQQVNSDYRIVLIQQNSGAVAKEIVVRSSTSVFFIPNLSINNMNYSVGIEKSEARKHGIEPMMMEFTADSTFKYVKLTIRPERRSSEVEVSKTNCFGLALIVIITLWFLNQAKAKTITDKLGDYIQIALHNAHNYDATQSNEDNLHRKRKAKK